jgi:hypothetical protein
MSVTIPVCLTINEERFIRQCLTPLANVFPVVIVADTGSTDNNLAEIAKVPNVHLIQTGLLSFQELGDMRAEMAQIAKRQYGASHIMQVDGDEIYLTSYARYIFEHPLPEGMIAGYTHGVELDELPNGEIWRYNRDYNRCAVFSVDSKWHGDYPFEAPYAYQIDRPELNYYWPSAPGLEFYHMHHLWRSSKDAETRWRVEKKTQFAMVTDPGAQLVSKFLNSWSEYADQ